MKLYNQNSQQFEELYGKDAELALQSGAFTVEKGQTYNLINPKNELIGIDGEQLFDALKMGYKVADKDRVSLGKELKEYDKLNIQTAAFDALKVASFGTSDYALVKAGLVSPEYLKKLRQANPNVSLGAEIAGMLGTGIPGATRGLTGKAVSKGLEGVAKYTPNYWLSRGFGSMERSALNSMKRRIPKDKIFKNAMAGLGAGALAGAGEGAIVGAGQFLSEAALGDLDITASAVFDKVKTGALLGGGLGAVGGFAIEGAGATGSKIKKIAGKIAGLTDKELNSYPAWGRKLLKSATGVSEEAQIKFLANPEGLENIRPKDELVEEILSRYELLAKKVEEGTVDENFLKDAIKKQTKEIDLSVRDKKKLIEDTEKIINSNVQAWKDNVKNNPIDEDLYTKLVDYRTRLPRKLKEISETSYGILEKYPNQKVITKKQFLQLWRDKLKDYKIADVTKRAVSEEEQTAIKWLEERIKHYDNVIKKGDIDPVSAKNILRALDDDTGSYKQAFSPMGDKTKDKIRKSIRRELDKSLKEEIEEYKIYMDRHRPVFELQSSLSDAYKNEEQLRTVLAGAYTNLNGKRINDLRTLGNIFDDSLTNQFVGMAKKQLLANNKKVTDGILLYDYFKKKGYKNPLDTTKMAVRRGFKPSTFIKEDYYRKTNVVKSLSEMGDKDASDFLVKYEYLPDDYDELIKLKKEFENLDKGRKPVEVVRKNFEEKFGKAIAFKSKKINGELSEEMLAVDEAEKKLSEIIRKNIANKQKLRGIQDFSSIDKINSKISSQLSAAQSKPILELFKKIGEVKPGDNVDFVGWVESLRLEHHFSTTFTRGSRNVNLWRGISLAAGGLIGAAIPGINFVAGGAVGGVVGNALGAAIGGLIDSFGPGIAKAILRRIARNKGNLTSTNVTNAIIKSTNLGDDAAKLLETQARGFKKLSDSSRKIISDTNNSVSGYLTAATTITLPQTAVVFGLNEKDYRELEDFMADVEMSKDIYMNEVDEINYSLFTAFPAFSENLRQKMIRASDFLAHKFPYRPSNDVFEMWEPTEYELNKFRRYATFTYQPSKILEELNSGYISPEAIETMKYIHPNLYALVTEILTDTLIDNKKYPSLPPAKKYQLSRYFGLDPLQMYRPDKMMIAQGIARQGGQEQEEAMDSNVTKKKESTGIRMAGVDKMDTGDREKTRMGQINTRV